MSRFARWHWIAPLVYAGVPAVAAWHDDGPGGGTPAHYGHLTGYNSDTDVACRNLQGAAVASLCSGRSR